jgi:hypothetical protein
VSYFLFCTARPFFIPREQNSKASIIGFDDLKQPRHQLQISNSNMKHNDEARSGSLVDAIMRASSMAPSRSEQERRARLRNAQALMGYGSIQDAVNEALAFVENLQFPDSGEEIDSEGESPRGAPRRNGNDDQNDTEPKQ